MSVRVDVEKGEVAGVERSHSGSFTVSLGGAEVRFESESDAVVLARRILIRMGEGGVVLTAAEIRERINSATDVDEFLPRVQHAALCAVVGELVAEAVLAERERCAAAIEGFKTDQPGIGVSHWGVALAKAIRERGSQASSPPSPATSPSVWTRTPPTAVGWYIWRDTVCDLHESVHVTPDRPANEGAGGEWCGPLPVPS